MSSRKKIFIAVILVAIGVAGRLIPHPWNFAPLTGIALFAGAYLGVRYAFPITALAMLLGDLFIGFYEWPLMLTIYGCYLLISLIGVVAGKYKSTEFIAASSLLSSVFFFLATNWAVWQFSPWYAKTWPGLLTCYTLALPFFRNTILGDLFFTGVLFGAYELARYMAKAVFRKSAVLRIGE